MKWEVMKERLKAMRPAHACRPALVMRMGNGTGK